MVEIAFKRFIDFLNDTPEYNKYAKSIRPEQITKDMVEAFTEYPAEQKLRARVQRVYMHGLRK